MEKMMFRKMMIVGAALMLCMSSCDKITGSEEKRNFDPNNMPIDSNLYEIYSENEHSFIYKFKTNRSGLLRMDSIPNLNVTVDLKDADNSTLCSYTNGLLCNIKSGEYNLKISTAWNSTPSSNVKAKFKVYFDSIDVSEYNNEMSNAYKLQFSNPVMNRISSTTDIDWYKFNVPKPMLVTVNIDSIPTNLDLTIGLYDDDGTLIENGSYTNDNRLFKYSFSLKSGDYYVKISNTWKSSYNIKPFRVSVSQYVVDSTEYNDAISNAFSIDLNKWYSANIWPTYDKDYYSFVAVDTGTYYFATDSLSSKLRLNCAVVDDEGTEITSNEISSFSYKVKKPGIVYFKFYNFYGYTGSEKRYNFKLMLK